MEVFEDLAGQQVLVTLIVLHQLVYLLVKNRPHSNYLRNLVVFVAVHKRAYIVSFFYDLLWNRILGIQLVFSYNALFRSLAESALNAEVFFLARLDQGRSCDKVRERLSFIDAVLGPFSDGLELLQCHVAISTLFTRVELQLFINQCHGLIKAVDVLLDNLKLVLRTFFNFIE